MSQFTDAQLETTKRVAAKLHSFYDGLAGDEREVFDHAVRRLVAEDEEGDIQGYRWREDDKPERPRPVDPWDGKPWPWGLGVPPLTNPEATLRRA